MSLPLSPKFRGDRYEYSAILPASVTGSTRFTLAAELNDDSYTSAGSEFAGAENPSVEIEDGTYSEDVGSVSELRAAEDQSIKLNLAGIGIETVTYTINVTVQT